MPGHSACLHIRLLGTPEFIWSGRQLTAIGRSRVTTLLLAYLSIYSNQAHSRDKLATILWPELVATRARRNLNNALWELRKSLPRRPRGREYLVVTSQSIQFNQLAPYRLDVAEFEQGIHDLIFEVQPIEASVRLAEAALELYRGDFLREFDAEWCTAKRLALRESYLLALEKLIATYRAHNKWDQALRSAQRLIQEDPLREAGHYQLVSLFIDLHRFSEARQSYERYVNLWQQELQIDPSAQMQALAQEVDPHLGILGSILDEDALTQNVRLLQELIDQLQPPESLLPHSNNPRQNDLALRISAYAEQLGLRLKKHQLIRPAADYLALAAASLTSLSPTPETQFREVDLRRLCNQLYDLLADRKQQARNLSRARELAIALQDKNLETEMLIHTAWMEMRQCQYEQAAETLATALSLAREGVSASWQGVCERLLGIIGDETGDYRSAIRHHLSALEIHLLEQNELAIHIDRVNLSSAFTATGRYAEALEQLTLAATGLANSTQALLRATCSGNFGNLWLKLGQYARAWPLIQEALKLTRRTGDRETECWVISRLASYYYEVGDHDQALHLARHYYTVARDLGLWRRAVELADILSATWLALGNSAGALADAEVLLRLATDHNIKRYAIRGRYRAAQAQFKLHDYQKAFQNCERMLALYEEIGQDLEEAPDLYWLAARCSQKAHARWPAENLRRQAQHELNRIVQSISTPELRDGYLSRQTHILSAN